MDDRGEKIITLAREMLRNPTPHPPTRSLSHITMSFKVLCITTLITAIGSSVITELNLEQKRPLNRYERVELDALLFYTSHVKGVDENKLRSDVSTRLGLSSFDDITESDFSFVRTYLQKSVQQP